MRYLLTLFGLFFFAIANSQPKSLNDISERYAIASLPDFFELLALPNVASKAEDIEKNVQWCEKAFAERGFITQRLSTPTVPLLLAERKFKKAKKTVLIYLQIDGQPVNPSQWDQESPWIATVKEKQADGNWKTIPSPDWQKSDRSWRIFARSASDAKGPAVAFLAALKAMDDLKITPDYNIKVIMDFEEELGSPNLPAAVKTYSQALKSDWLIIFDGPRHVSNQPTLSFGARGICEITLTTFGPRNHMHSGNYGNYAPNPAFGLAHLLASMKDTDGRVLIPGFYDGVNLTESEKATLKNVPDNETELKRFLGIATPEKVAPTFQEALQYPTLNIRGLNSLYIGEKARTLIPAWATAEIDIRLVPSSDPDRLINLVKKHVEDQGYYLVKDQPTEEERSKYAKLAAIQSKFSYGSFQTPFDSPLGLWLNRAMVHTFQKEPIKIRMMGGSIPISPFVVTLGIPAVSVTTVNADNNQHAENENILLGNYIDAVHTFLQILAEPIQEK